MSQKSSLPQPTQSVSRVLTADMAGAKKSSKVLNCDVLELFENRWRQFDFKRRSCS
jgi:hypothetical protein